MQLSHSFITRIFHSVIAAFYYSLVMVLLLSLLLKSKNKIIIIIIIIFFPCFSNYTFSFMWIKFLAYLMANSVAKKTQLFRIDTNKFVESKSLNQRKYGWTVFLMMDYNPVDISWRADDDGDDVWQLLFFLGSVMFFDHRWGLIHYRVVKVLQLAVTCSSFHRRRQNIVFSTNFTLRWSFFNFF